LPQSTLSRVPNLPVVDGRYIGHDGFVVPKNFDEFHERFPEDSSMLPAMEAIAAVGTWGAAAGLLGKTKAEFCCMRSRLRQLGRCFQTGKRVLCAAGVYSAPEVSLARSSDHGAK